MLKYERKEHYINSKGCEYGSHTILFTRCWAYWLSLLLAILVCSRGRQSCRMSFGLRFYGPYPYLTHPPYRQYHGWTLIPVKGNEGEEWFLM